MIAILSITFAVIIAGFLINELKSKGILGWLLILVVLMVAVLMLVFWLI